MLDMEVGIPHPRDLTEDEVDSVSGGSPLVIAIALGGLFIAAFDAGYEFGKDLATS